MNELHNLQIIMNNNTDVAKNVSAIDTSFSASKNINLINQIQEYQREKQKIKKNENIEKKNINIDEKEQNIEKENKNIKNKIKNKKYLFDEYRGKNLDIRL
ncbi:hypothetical protein OF820_01905 [Oceanotoga sp. DSM 15011]|jgi:cell division protein FtsB|uniref:Uncharacterized protein n=1 Tax=Oceanotoga teriensis TaxID=515440 RepID=A0AA45HI32_9BACT|nr:MULTISPECIES: hypothetical protein [Oceanotoga]MDO7977335.1 hypothetical protein [Oceanotoga teriensis]PWJ88726.1 hypothetical protein C7380_11716 [Oceanotoga teriensis]UYP00446.1 hypothetical protein OF820_01905 [Oceanotoga sp. DSM 15011]